MQAESLNMISLNFSLSKPKTKLANSIAGKVQSPKINIISDESAAFALKIPSAKK